ncbi:MAG TPA: aconitase family protein, partial [Thermoplasmata archaeon]
MNASDPLGLVEPFADGAGSASLVRLSRLAGFDADRYAQLPLTLRLLSENLARNFDARRVEEKDVTRLVRGELAASEFDFPYYPSRVLLQDFTGVPVLVDLAALRSAAVRRGLPVERVDPVVPVDLIADHSVQVDSYGSPRSLAINLDREYSRNAERYALLRWAGGAFRNLRVVPPGNGICHQVNLEYIASVVAREERGGRSFVFPDSVVGTDSHTTMVNGLGVLGWGVGGIEAEAVMMGQPYYLSRPTVVGVHLTGALPEGATATDLVLTVTRALRHHGVVEKFVEFFGPGVAALSVPDRATLSNMCPEYGATAALFPIDDATTTYLTATGRTPEAVDRVRRYAQLQGFWNTGALDGLRFDERVEVDLASIVPTIAGPRNPEESVALSEAAVSFRSARDAYRADHPAHNGHASTEVPITDGSVVIAAITSCTNTSNPSVMIGAGLIAQRANAL